MTQCLMCYQVHCVNLLLELTAKSFFFNTPSSCVTLSSGLLASSSSG